MLGLVALVAVVADPAPVFADAPLLPRQVPPEVYLDRSGLPELVVQNVVFGGLAGLAITQAVFTESNDIRAVAGLPLGIGAGVALPLILTRGKPMRSEQAAFYNFGERWGAANGALLPLLWGSRRPREYWASTAAFFAVGLGGALYLEPELQLNPGQVAALGSAHTFGTLSAGLVMLLFDIVPEGSPAFAGPVLFVSNAAVVAAYLGRDTFSIDRRRVFWVDIGGYLGGAVGVGTGLLIAGGDNFRGKAQLYGATTLAGMALGMVSAYVLSEDLDEYKRGVTSPDEAFSLAPPTITFFESRSGKAAPSVDVLRGRF